MFKTISLSILVIIGLIIRIMCLGAPGHVIDMMTLSQWMLSFADHPWLNAYAYTNSNYPPMYVIIYKITGELYRTVIQYDPTQYFVHAFVKAPCVLFDLISGVLIYFIAAKYDKCLIPLLAAALWLLNPAVIYDSSYWGQLDSASIAFTLGAILCLINNQKLFVYILLFLGALIKPQMIVLTPLFLADIFVVNKLKNYITHGIALMLGLIACYLVALPFFGDINPLVVFSNLEYRLVTGSALYPFTTTNAFNWWALWGDFFQSDDNYKTISEIVFIIFNLTVCTWYALHRKTENFIEVAFLIMFAFFMILTEMHERYLIFSIPFICIIAARYRHIFLKFDYIAITLVLWMNLEYSIVYEWVQNDQPNFGLRPHEFMPALVHLCVLTNIFIFLRILWWYLQIPKKLLTCN